MNTVTVEAVVPRTRADRVFAAVAELDLRQFPGRWSVFQVGGDAAVRFETPADERGSPAMAERIRALLRRLLGEDVRFPD